MVARDEVMGLLLEACPGFRPVYEDYLEEMYGPEAPALNLYADGAQLNGYLVKAAGEGQTECFPAVFALAERLLVEGDQHVHDWVTTGLLEGLRNHLSWTNLGHDVFLPWLGLQSRVWWQRLIEPLP
ncbi:MAG TPA: hypothetical protein VGP82_02965 [Ktedonobacterales bacterium]|nr:hypothetical protein [Ktedonobacterales bacterium]